MANPVSLSIATDLGLSNTDLITSDNTLVLSGIADASITVEITVTQVAGSVVIASQFPVATSVGGLWTFDLDAFLSNVPLADGNYTVDVVDTGDNETNGFSFTVDTTAPVSTPTLATTISADSGVSSTDLITSDTTVTVTGTSSAADGERVEILVGGVSNGFATVTSGAWSYTTTAQADGAASITAADVDAAGNRGTQTGALSVTVDTTAPVSTPTLGTTISADTGVSATDLITSDTTVTVTGTSSAADGERVQVFVGGTSNGFATVTSGAWSYTTTALTDGVRSITVADVDAAGNAGSQTSALVVTISTGAPVSTPTLATTITTDTGVSATDLVTSDNTVAVGGTSTAANGERVEIFVGGVSNGFATVASGAWTYTTTALADGARSITVADVDGAGNAGTQTSALVVTIDTTAPVTTPTVAATISLDSGISTTDLVTNDNTPTIGGSTVANGRVQVFVGGVSIGFATANVSGAWSYTTSALADGARSITVADVDTAGNAGTQSSALVVNVDTVAPLTTPTVATTISLDTGRTATDRITNDNTVTVTGTTVANGRVQVFVGGVANGFALASVAGAWSYTTTALADGIASLAAADVDTAGNVGTPGATLNVIIDTVAPISMPSVYDVSQTPTAGGYAVNVTGNAEAGSVVSLRDFGTVVGTATAGSDGNWNVSVSLANENHTFTVVATDTAGNVSAAGGVAAPLVSLTSTPEPSNDVNADGRDDILWQGSDGSLVAWTMNAGFQAGGGRVGPNPGPNWQAKDFGDFDGDGKADVLWQNTNGAVAIWTLNGTTPIAGAVLAVAPSPDWVVRGAGDFDGDGKDDILWQNTSGAVVIWKMDGFQINGGGAVGTNPGPAWTVKFAADFNGDGKSDILWQNANGAVAIWTMNGTAVTTGTVLPTNPGTDWSIKAAGDVSGDGKADIIFQRTDGSVAIWTTNGSSVTGGGVLGVNPGATWQVEGSADYNGDGADDILFQNNDGSVAIWAMNGTRVIGGDLLSVNPGTAWDVI